MFHPRQTKSFLRWSQYAFFIVGILALGYVGFALADARFYQAYQTLRFQKTLNGLGPSVGSGDHLSPPLLPPSLAEANHARAESLLMAESGGFPLGRIEISSIGLAAMILEGTDEGTLRRAVGHVAGSSLPGQKGNIAIAGHRDTFFRGLRNIHTDDEITLTTLTGFYRYRVDSAKVVQPEDTDVLDESDDSILTLVTCYPFYFIGSAPQRFIVRAHRSPG